MISAFVVCATLTACATPRYDPITDPPTQPGPPLITPVGMGDLRGTEVLIFPDIDVPTAIAGVEGYAARCLSGPNLRRISEPHGFSLVDAPGEPYLRVTVASVSESSALGLGGTGLTPVVKEAIAATVRGRPRCAP